MHFRCQSTLSHQTVVRLMSPIHPYPSPDFLDDTPLLNSLSALLFKNEVSHLLHLNGSDSQWHRRRTAPLSVLSCTLLLFGTFQHVDLLPTNRGAATSEMLKVVISLRAELLSASTTVRHRLLDLGLLANWMNRHHPSDERSDSDGRWASRRMPTDGWYPTNPTMNGGWITWVCGWVVVGRHRKASGSFMITFDVRGGNPTPKTLWSNNKNTEQMDGPAPESLCSLACPSSYISLKC
ncbi:hypothetical protein WG66_012658 [Moniliophthora roreri]|nr:hypothetical protein WG66_012658 [Moniliophthora roreri]